MRIVQINMCHNGSTGTIMLQIARKARALGHEVTTFSTHQFSVKYKPLPEAPPGHVYYGSYSENAVHYILARQSGYNGCFSYFATKRLLKRIRRLSPDILHLHNLHGFCIHLPLLFDFIKKHNIKTVWTLHDCWSFTGHCPYFDVAACDKWKTGCGNCTLYREYPKSVRDVSAQLWHLKRKWFRGASGMTLVTPSEWLSGLVRKSFLQDYPVRVINNGIDLGVFCPTRSDFRREHDCEDKYVILGVAFGWSRRKGLDVFLDLSQRLDQRYQIVLVGTDSLLDQQLPSNIISIHRTQNQKELAALYTAADVFVIPTREDNYPTVNMEALACGTPVVTFRTGGSPEMVDETCGSVVEINDTDTLMREIVRICETRPYSQQACLDKSRSFDQECRFQEYIDLYEELYDRSSKN